MWFDTCRYLCNGHLSQDQHTEYLLPPYMPLQAFPRQHTPELFVLQLGDPCVRVYVELLCSFVKFPLRLMLVKFIHINDQCDALVSVMDVEAERN